MSIFQYSCSKTSGDTFESYFLYNTLKKGESLACGFKGWLLTDGVWNFSNNDSTTTFLFLLAMSCKSVSFCAKVGFVALDEAFCKLKIFFRSKGRLHTLRHFKDSLEKKIRSGIIYRYRCSNCNITYYGKTFRHIYTRTAEHMGFSNLTWKRLKNFKQSAVPNHHLQCNCAINFDNFEFCRI